MKTSARELEILSRGCIALCLLCLAGSAQGVTFSVFPSIVSNTYAGTIALQVGQLTNGETVVLQRFTDANTNGVIDAADWLIQQFRLTDGTASVIGGATNLNVPNDTTPADGVISATQSMLTAGIAPQLVGQYLYKLSSPGGRFTPLTNAFTVTNHAFGQSFAGSVRSGGTNVPHAGVLVFTPDPSGEGLGSPVAGTVANATGLYSVKVPAGTYLVWAFQNGYVADLSVTPTLTLGAGATISTNLSLVPGTRTISGRVVDATNSSLGLAGILSAWSSSAGQLGVQFTDTNGSFNASVTAGNWEFGGDDAPFTTLGYLQWETWPTVNTATGSVAGVMLAVPKGTALFHGSVKDELGQALPGVNLYSIHDNWNGPYASSATTDENGNYAMAVNAGTWALEVDDEYSGYDNYLFSPPRSANFTFTNGQAVQQDFTALPATNLITGWVRQTNDTPFSGLAVWAQARINGKDYQAWSQTDDAGNYRLRVANGDWTVGLDCFGGDDSLQQFGNFQCPENQAVGITNNNGVAEFTVRPPEPLQITTTSLPDGAEGLFYSQQLSASGGQPPYSWYLPQGTASLPPGTMSLSGDGTLSGIPTAAGTYNFWVGVWDNTGATQVTQQFALTIHALLQITTTTLPNGTQNAPYNQQLTAAGGQPPYHWYLPGGTVSLPPGTMNLSDAGILSGVPSDAGTYQFWVGVSDDTWLVTETQQLSLTISAPSPDAHSYYVVKTKAFRQFDAANVGLDTNSWPFIATLGIMQSSLGAVPIANVTLPTTAVKAFPAGSSTLELRVREYFSDEAAFDTVYPVGNYTFTLFGVHDGLKSPILNLPAPPYPNAPRLSDFAAAQSVNPGQSFLLQWDAFSGGTANDSIWVVITDAVDQPVFSTPNPAVDPSGALKGTATSVTIPAGTLQLGQTYQGRLHFLKIISVNTTQYPGAAGVVMATAMTTFPMATLSGAPTLSHPEKPSASVFRFVVNGIAGQNYTIEGSSNLINWNPIRVTNAPTDAFTVQLVRATNHHGFYRVKLGL